MTIHMYSMVDKDVLGEVLGKVVVLSVMRRLLMLALLVLVLLSPPLLLVSGIFCMGCGGGRVQDEVSLSFFM